MLGRVLEEMEQLSGQTPDWAGGGVPCRVPPRDGRARGLRTFSALGHALPWGPHKITGGGHQVQSLARCTWKLETSRPQGGLELGVGKRSSRSLTHSLNTWGRGSGGASAPAERQAKTRRPPFCSQERPGTAPPSGHRCHSELSFVHAAAGPTCQDQHPAFRPREEQGGHAQDQGPQWQPNRDNPKYSPSVHRLGGFFFPEVYMAFVVTG